MQSGNLLNHVGHRVFQNILFGKRPGKLIFFDGNAFNGSLTGIIEGR